MHGHETVNLKRDVEGSMVPVGEKVTLLKDEEATIPQSLGGTYTVIVNGNMFSIAGRDADALGREPELTPAEMAGKAETQEELENIDPSQACAAARFGMNSGYHVKHVPD